MNLSLSLAGLLTSNSLDLKRQKNPRISQAAVEYKLFQMWIFYTVFNHVNWMLVICPVFCQETVLI